MKPVCLRISAYYLKFGATDHLLILIVLDVGVDSDKGNCRESRQHRLNASSLASLSLLSSLVSVSHEGPAGQGRTCQEVSEHTYVPEQGREMSADGHHHLGKIAKNWN